jgi:hypothetical protein
MRIDQRNAGASVTPTNLQYTVDRWYAFLTQASKFSVQQNAGSVTPPVGFTNYLGITSTSSYSVSSTDIFTLEQIEKLAIDYRLRFLNSRYFTGKFDVEVAAKIKEFGRENNMSLNEYHLKNNFFILGPKEIFDLKDEKYIEPKQLDPVLFYKLDDNHYRMIHKWGSDFTILRYLEGFKWKNIWNHFWFNMFAFFPMFAFLIGLITSLSWATFSVGSMLLIASSVVVPTAIFVFFRYTISKMDSDGDEIKGFFTPGNWTSTNNIVR